MSFRERIAKNLAEGFARLNKAAEELKAKNKKQSGE
jgi:hypothetical protein